MLISFEAVIEKFAEKGEKTSWTYLLIETEIANQINPGVKKIYRIKGSLNLLPIEQIALMPMGDGSFILPLNQTLRKQLKINVGDIIRVSLEVDNNEKEVNSYLMDCLSIEPKALAFFRTLSKSHQKYFSNWISAAKTTTTIENRLVMTLDALQNKWDYPTMIKYHKK